MTADARTDAAASLRPWRQPWRVTPEPIITLDSSAHLQPGPAYCRRLSCCGLTLNWRLLSRFLQIQPAGSVGLGLVRVSVRVSVSLRILLMELFHSTCVIVLQISVLFRADTVFFLIFECLCVFSCFIVYFQEWLHVFSGPFTDTFEVLSISVF